MDKTTIAVVASFGSLAISTYVAWRDRRRVKARADAFHSEETGEYASVRITATNVGRRTVILRGLTGVYEDATRSGEVISVRLGEAEQYEYTFGKFDGIMINDVSSLKDLFFSDTTGKKIRIAGARRCIALLRQSGHRFGIRTH